MTGDRARETRGRQTELDRGHSLRSRVSAPIQRGLGRNKAVSRPIADSYAKNGSTASKTFPRPPMVALQEHRWELLTNRESDGSASYFNPALLKIPY